MTFDRARVRQLAECWLVGHRFGFWQGVLSPSDTQFIYYRQCSRCQKIDAQQPIDIRAI